MKISSAATVFKGWKTHAITDISKVISENIKWNKSIKSKLLGGPGSVVGPISSGGQHVVLRLISTYEKGTTKEQIHIEETLRNQLFAMKAHALRQNLVDSLKSKYAVSK